MHFFLMPDIAAETIDDIGQANYEGSRFHPISRMRNAYFSLDAGKHMFNFALYFLDTVIDLKSDFVHCSHLRFLGVTVLKKHSL